jgi:glycosyltransferase involved in cell wall biosynthesis
MEFADLAIVIPTLNEEDYIGKLLDSIAAQTLQPKEIVVIDANSPDNTMEEIKKRQKALPQLQYYQTPKHTISRQRNIGVSKTRSQHLLFLDADMELKETDTIEKYMQEILFSHPDIAAAMNQPNSSDIRDKIYFIYMNTTMRLSRYIWPWITGMNIYVSRNAFEQVQGFDEEVAIGEDMDLLQRMLKKRKKFLFLKNPKPYTSVRRFEKEGRVKFTLMIILSLLFVVFIGYKKNPIAKKYEFGQFGKKK